MTTTVLRIVTRAVFKRLVLAAVCVRACADHFRRASGRAGSASATIALAIFVHFGGSAIRRPAVPSFGRASGGVQPGAAPWSDGPRTVDAGAHDRSVITMIVRFSPRPRMEYRVTVLFSPQTLSRGLRDRASVAWALRSRWPSAPLLAFVVLAAGAIPFIRARRRCLGSGRISPNARRLVVPHGLFPHRCGPILPSCLVWFSVPGRDDAFSRHEKIAGDRLADSASAIGP